MGTWSYKVRDSRGQIKKGELEARDKESAKKTLIGSRLKIISLQRIAKDGEDLSLEETPVLGEFVYKDANGNLQIVLGSQSPSTKDLIIFTKQFSTMLNSGVPMIQSLSILSKQQQTRGFSRALHKIKLSVENGASLSESLAEEKTIFDPLYIAMVQAGEASGNLDSILIKLVSYIQKAEKIKEQIKSAMTYPVIVLFVAFAVITGLLAFVVPTFAQQYADNERTLPQLTLMVIHFSDFFAANWLYMCVLLLLIFIGFKYWLRTEKGRIKFDAWILKAPVIGTLLVKISIGRFCSTMSSMLSSGVNLLDALSICASSSGNKYVENFVLNIRSSLEKGSKFSEPLSEGGLFPEMVVSMVSVGEATGALEEMLGKVSEFYEEEVDLAVATMLSLIEPVMIIFIGGIIAFIVVAMYLPVFEMAGGITS